MYFPFASLSCHLIGYWLPGFPLLIPGGFRIGGRNPPPTMSNRTWTTCVTGAELSVPSVATSVNVYVPTGHPDGGAWMSFDVKLPRFWTGPLGGVSVQRRFAAGRIFPSAS